MTDQPYPPLRPQPPLRSRRRRATPWAMIIGGILLTVLVIALAVILLGGSPDGTADDASSSHSPAASGSEPSAQPEASTSAAPSASAAAGTFAPDAVVATAVEALTLRAAPGLAADDLWRLPAGVLGFVIGGPVDADGHRWYQLSGMGLPFGSGCVTPEPGELLECPAFLGWVAAAAEDGTPWLQAATAPECPAGPHDVVGLSERAYTSRLICFDAEPLTFVAWWPPPPEDTSPGGECPATATEIGWLVCQNTNDKLLGANPEEGGGRWAVSIDPATGLTMPERGQWIEVTGHFDDPAAQRCADAAEIMGSDAGTLVFNCRLQFVLSAVAPSTGP